MKFLVDAQLPLRFAQWLKRRGHDSLHTLDLPPDNRTPGTDIIACAIHEGRIIVTKGSDFARTYLLTGQASLLFISAGNIGNAELVLLLQRNLPAIQGAFASCRHVEIARTTLIIHE